MVTMIKKGTRGTKPPTGLALTRSGNKFTLTWKCGDADYDLGQQYERRINYMTASGANKSTEWSSHSISASQRKEATTTTWTSWYPSTEKRVTSIETRVRGRRAPYVSGTTTYLEDWSPWASKSYTISPPLKPTLSASLDSVLWNKTTFSWSYADDTPIHRPFYDIQYQSILIKDCTETDGSKLSWTSSNIGWRTGSTGTSGSLAITEDTLTISGKSYTRWFRVRARGAGGYSAWVYRKHVYALPYPAVISSAIAKETSAGTNIYVKWTATSNPSRPIDSVTIQYVSATPQAGLVCPPGQTWTDALVQGDTSGADAASFTDNILVDLDECLWIRVNTQHDEQLITPGTPARVKVGRLTDPDNLSVSADPDTFLATINADNNSAVPDSFLAVRYKTASDPSGSFIIGIIPHGQTSTTVQCPDFSGQTIDFGVYAVQGSYSLKTRADGVSQYVVTENMTSETIWDGGTIPSAPTLTGVPTDTPGTVRLSWDWTWSEATGAELSWADHSDAWESTDEPDDYEVTSIHSSQWNVAGLEEGRVWYFRVRLKKVAASGEETFGTYSDIISVNLSSAPLIPSLELDKPIITEDGQVTASWSYVSTDGTRQAIAEICEYVGGVYGDPIATVETAQHITLYATDQGWTSSNIYNLCVRVVSASGQESGWSEAVPVTISDPLTISVTTSLASLTIDGDTVNGLTSLPLTVDITGAGEGGTTTLAIERLLPYFIDRPDGTVSQGFAGETVALITQTGEAQIIIDNDVLIGELDDGAWYKIVASIEDGYGQTEVEEIDFIIQWSHQAIIPTATITYDDDSKTAVITPKTPVGALMGDTVDIYRLSADKPEIIYPGAEFETSYLDPYPAIGASGGYRIVFKTSDGDYITVDNEIAWKDYEGGLNTPYSMIDFNGETVMVLLNQNIGSSWSKDFKETKYLGGTINGDWNRGVSMTGSVSTYAIKTKDRDVISSLRRLAVYTGVCHVRTIDGASYAADVQVSEDFNFDNFGASFSLKITRVDGEGYDGVLLSDWEVSV